MRIIIEHKPSFVDYEDAKQFYFTSNDTLKKYRKFFDFLEYDSNDPDHVFVIFSKTYRESFESLEKYPDLKVFFKKMEVQND